VVSIISNEFEFTARNVVVAKEALSTFDAVDIRLPDPEQPLKPSVPADVVFAGD
jgi:hypothetical protein